MSSYGRGKFQAWVQIARLQFFPMTWIAYTMGSLACSVFSRKWDLLPYLLGYLVIFLIELSTILVNEYYDYETDRVNQNYSPFTGGSRVLVEGKLSFREVRNVIRAILFTIPLLGYLLVKTDTGELAGSVYLLLGVGLFLGLGYTLPPLRFCYLGAGELVVGLTHSFYVILCGYAFQGGSLLDPLPWFLGIPLFFAIIAAIVLAGLPDRLADDGVAKKTVAVMFGPRSAIAISMLFVVFAFLAALALVHFQVIRLSPILWNLLVLPHGLILLYALFRLLKSGLYDRRIDGVMVLSLTYILWFGLLPFIALR